MENIEAKVTEEEFAVLTPLTAEQDQYLNFRVQIFEAVKQLNKRDRLQLYSRLKLEFNG